MDRTIAAAPTAAATANATAAAVGQEQEHKKSHTNLLLENWAFGVRDLCVNCAELCNGREKTKNKKQLTQKIKKHMLFSSSDFSSHR
jgi:hypothetical protein